MKDLKIKNERLRKIVDDYDKISSWLKKHENVLRILEKDHELLTGKSYRINFAVDFHEIHQMVFPLGDEEREGGSKRNEWVQKKVLSQAGRICLFYGFESAPVPVLLPPYRDELEDFLIWLKAEYKKAEEQFQLLSDLKKDIRKDFQKQGIEFKKTGEQVDVSPGDYEKIVQFIKKHFFQLNFLLMGGYKEKLSILRALFSDEKKKKRIELVSDRWREYSRFIDSEVENVPKDWNEFISCHRPKKKRANSRDILALHLIKALNRKFKEENKKEIVLLVSDARIFEDLLNPTLEDDENNNTIGGFFETATGENIKFRRTTDVFHTYLLIKKERNELKKLYKEESPAHITLINVIDDLNKIKSIENFVKEIIQIIEFCNDNERNCQNLESCQYEAICTDSENVIKKFQEDRKSLDSLALAEEFDVFAKIYTQYQKIVDFGSGVKQILSLLHDNEKIVDRINKELEEIRQHFNEPFKELTYKLEYERKVIKIPKANSFRIKTYKDNIDEIIREIQRSIRQNNRDNFSNYFSALKLERNRITQSKSLEYLLSTLISAAYDKYELSLYFLDRGLFFTAPQNRLYKELKYLEAILYCNDEEYDKSLTLCKELVKKFQSDPRFLYFCGYIILTAKDFDKLKENTYEEAVDYCRKALSKIKEIKETRDADADLKLYSLNNLIYGLAKIGTHVSINEAEKHMGKLTKCSIPAQDWGEHIYHTIGYVHFMNANLLKKENLDYSETISEAIENFEKAYEFSHNSIIKQDLDKAKELKNALPLG